jgi:hypothetical protein
VIIGVLLTLLMLGRGWHSLTQKSATFDEWGHLESGLAVCARDSGVFPFALTNLINPPLARILAASAVGHREWRAASLPPPEAPRCRAERKWRERLGAFPFRYDVDSVALVHRARLPVLVFSLLGIPLLMALARETGHPRAAPWAAMVYALCPNVMAHARLITPDLPVSVLCLATMLAWLRLQRRPSPSRVLVAGAILGMALATKYSAGLLLPVLVFAPLLALCENRFRALICSTLAGLLAAGLLIGLYSLTAVPFVTPSAVAVAEHGEEIARFLPLMKTWVGRHLAMPVVLYRYGAVVAGRAVMKSFLMEHHRFGGWLSYFPIAMAVKTPLAQLVALSLGAGWACRRRAWNPSLVWVAAFPAAYLAVTLAKGIQVGLRHVLPVYPFMALAAGMLLAAWWRAGGGRRWVSAALTLGMLGEGLSVHPHYLAFFNLGTGGPDRGYRYLVDCNLDWGQDLPALAEFQRRERTGTLTLSYFGNDLPERYGVDYQVLCAPHGAAPPPQGVYAISATQLQGLYQFPARLDGMAWFRQRAPTRLVGHSILVYDLRLEGGVSSETDDLTAEDALLKNGSR